MVIVSRITARRFWGDGDPIGRTLHRQGDRREYTVVGVVGEVRQTALSRESPAIYYASTAGRVWPLMDVVVRADGTPESLLPVIRERVRVLDPAVPVSTVDGASPPATTRTLPVAEPGASDVPVKPASDTVAGGSTPSESTVRCG